MKFLIPLLAVIGLISCSFVPKESDYDTNNLKKVQKCELKHQVNDSEKAIWWAWKIPAKPARCYLACVMSAFKWIDKKGNPKLDAIKKSYKAVGHEDSAPNQQFIKKNCGRKLPKNPCDKAILLYACFLVRSENLQHFKDAFDGKPNTI
uniref:Cul o 6 allergen n=1 Tax=Culicoides obsoletus TaxID=289301 RepID=M4WGB0_CULOB|nr:Cul o 6 allergen [Culicoides obsoletus]